MGQGINCNPEIALSLQYKFSVGSTGFWHFGLVIPGSQSMFQSEILKQEHCPVFWARKGKLRSSVFIIRRPLADY
jgi:hypothetical protein